MIVLSRRNLVAVLMFLFVWTLTTHGKYSASGDEPHYLMVTQSLVADHDLDLANNYANNDGRLFGHDHLLTGAHVARDRVGRLASVHDIGLSILLVVPYIAARSLANRVPTAILNRFRMDGGLFTYALISVMLIALTAVAVALLVDAAVSVSGRPWSAWVIGLAAISPPIASHAFLVFPDVIAFFVTVIVVWYSTRTAADDARWFPWLATALGLLPWMHRKYSFYVFGLLFLVLWLRRDVVRRLSKRLFALAVMLFLVPQFALHLWTIVQWGTIWGPQLVGPSAFNISTLAAGLPGLWLDRQSGVLAYAPLYWIVPVCWIVSWHRTWPYFVPALLLYVPMAAFVEWWGGFAPAARYLVPIMPLCLVAVVASLRFRTIVVLIVVLAIPQVLIDAIAWQHPRTLWPASDRVNPLLISVGAPGRAYQRLLPGLRGGDE